MGWNLWNNSRFSLRLTRVLCFIPLQYGTRHADTEFPSVFCKLIRSISPLLAKPPLSTFPSRLARANRELRPIAKALFIRFAYHRTVGMQMQPILKRQPGVTHCIPLKVETPPTNSHKLLIALPWLGSNIYIDRRVYWRLYKALALSDRTDRGLLER